MQKPTNPEDPSQKGPYRHPEFIHFRAVQTAFVPHPTPLDIKKLKSPEDGLAITLVRNNIPISSHTPFKLYKPKGDAMKRGVVAILDTGINTNHQDLVSRVVAQLHYKNSTNPVELTDHHGHGTHLAGIICGKHRDVIETIDGIPTTIHVGGVAEQGRVISVKVTDGSEGTTSWWKITEGLQRVLDYNESIKEEDIHDSISCVLIAYNAFDSVNDDMDTDAHSLSILINKLHEQHIPVVCSAGNMFELMSEKKVKGNKQGIAYPAYLANVLVAGALNNSNDLADFSQRRFVGAPPMKSNFITTHGDETLSTGIPGTKDYTFMKGSSQAAAVLAATVILLQDKYLQHHATLPSVQNIVAVLNSAAIPRDHRVGGTVLQFLSTDLASSIASM